MPSAGDTARGFCALRKAFSIAYPPWIVSLVVLCLLPMHVIAQSELINGDRVLVGTLNSCDDAGSTDAYACNLSPAITTYITGAVYQFKANTANTGAATLALNGLSAITIKKVVGGVTTDLADNDIRANQRVLVVYDGTNMQMLSTLANLPAALAANGANCSAGQFPLGVDASGAVESCTALPTTIAGTTNQIAASASTGAVTLSIPTNPTLPGTTTGTFSGSLSGNASTATALAANGANCSAGQAPLGVDASGAVESCFAVSTATSTDTFTNKTYDAEATGNVLTLPSHISLWAGGCQNTTAISFWDLPTSTPAVATCVTGTNIQKGVLAYADTSGGFSAQTSLTLPAKWTTTNGVDFSLYWTTSATSGNAKWTVQFVCTDVAASATDDPAFPSSGNGFNTVTTAAPGTANRVQTSTVTGATMPSSCVTATAELLHIRVFRDGNDAADTIGATANFVALELVIRRAL
jgi:hypothetical protein